MNTPEVISEKQSFYECEDINVINQKILSQKTIMEEYKNWLKMLLNILNNNNDFDYYQQIKNVNFLTNNNYNYIKGLR